MGFNWVFKGLNVQMLAPKKNGLLSITTYLEKRQTSFAPLPLAKCITENTKIMKA
jgi:hypothetical protein